MAWSDSPLTFLSADALPWSLDQWTVAFVIVCPAPLTSLIHSQPPPCLPRLIVSVPLSLARSHALVLFLKNLKSEKKKTLIKCLKSSYLRRRVEWKENDDDEEKKTKNPEVQWICILRVIDVATKWMDV